MSARLRRLLVALAGGAVGAALAMALVFWIGGVFASDSPSTDGSFELVEPGVYSEPTSVPIADLTGDRLPPVELVDADAVSVALHEHLGSPMVVNVWYSTCPPCARELADFAVVHGELGDQVRFVGVDPRDTPEEMTAFAAARGVEYELFLDDGSWVTAMNVIAYPTTLLVDADGVIVHQAGVVDDDRLRELIAEYFDVT